MLRWMCGVTKKDRIRNLRGSGKVKEANREGHALRYTCLYQERDGEEDRKAGGLIKRYGNCGVKKRTH